jgi:hypothetical protein
LARELKKVKRFYYNVIVRSAEDKGVRVLTSGIKLFEKIIGACANPEIGDISDIKEGYDFIIRKRMKDGYWNYDLSEASRKQTPLSADQAKITLWTSGLFDLQKEVTILSYPELKALLDNHLAGNSSNIAPATVASTASVAPCVAAPQPATVAPQPTTPQTPPPPVVDEEPIDEEIENFKRNLEKLKGNG